MEKPSVTGSLNTVATGAATAASSKMPWMLAASSGALRRHSLRGPGTLLAHALGGPSALGGAVTDTPPAPPECPGPLPDPAAPGPCAPAPAPPVAPGGGPPILPTQAETI